MTEKSTSELQKKLLIFSVFISTSSFLIHEIYSLDVWWQIAIGKDILKTLSIPTTDRYTVAALGNLYHDSHWLFQVIIAAFHHLAGMLGAQFFMVAIWAITLYTCYRSIRQHMTVEISALFVFLVGLSSIERFLPRPEIITFLMIALFYQRLSKHNYKDGKALTIMALLQIIWTNCHGLFVIGPFMAGTYWLSDIIGHFSGKKTNLKKTSLLLAVLILASLITPYGIGAWKYAYLLYTEVGGSASHLMKSVGELAPTFSNKSFSEPLFYPFLIILAGTILSSLKLLFQKKLSLPRAIITISLFMAALTGRRNIVLFVIVAAPFIAENIKALMPEVKLKSPLTTNLIGLLILLVSIYPLSGLYYVKNDIPARSGLGSSPSYYPYSLPDFLRKINFQGNIYNSNIMGGFYLLHSYPERRPLTDGRWEIYNDRILKSILIAPTQPYLMQG
ncbi:MAG: hypothetical protein IMF07_00430, partial [Proteobacteria bacterium]|nr:hypothetical protein [Pseudomonadota bacterium]